MYFIKNDDIAHVKVNGRRCRREREADDFFEDRYGQTQVCKAELSQKAEIKGGETATVEFETWKEISAVAIRGHRYAYGSKYLTVKAEDGMKSQHDCDWYQLVGLKYGVHKY